VYHTPKIKESVMGYFTRLKKKTTDMWGKSYASSYWYDDYQKSFSAWDRYGEWGYEPAKISVAKKSANTYKLASVRRAIANFVHIVAGKHIDVVYASNSESYTDGTKVVLSADVDDNFDVSVGLALHEGSHIILSDFKMLGHLINLKGKFNHILSSDIENTDPYEYRKFMEFDMIPYGEQAYRIYSKDGPIRSKVEIDDNIHTLIMGLCNWIEDRRIDNYIYTTAPGYRNYYVSMYDHYFNDKIVTKGIASDEYTDETIDSYFFRIINLMNEKTDLTKLNGLLEISKILDIKNISRLRSSTDSLELAIDVIAVILKYTTKFGENLPQKSQEEGAESDTVGAESDTEIEVDDISDVDIVGSDSSDQNSNGVKIKLSPKALEQLKKKIQKQKDFLNGNIKKKKLSKEEITKVEAAEQSGTELQRVGVHLDGKMDVKGVDCIVVKNINDALIAQSDFPCKNYDKYSNHVHRGIQLGTILGKKLQIRAESRETVFNRLRQGKIDKRSIASLGYDSSSVFYTKDVDQYKNVNLHISLDYSGSMCGTKVEKTIVATAAIVKACSMARNIQVQVSIRTTSDRRMPWIGIIYDSRKDSIKKFINIISKIGPNNTTPEGLCFEAIHKQLIPVSNEMDSYFLNFSDGCPSFEVHRSESSINYHGEVAAKHTASQIKKMKDMGINVLSYYISDYTTKRIELSDDWKIFTMCYGDSSKYINVENMLEVAKTINDMFLKKS
jgi:hypothetical protein